jgi:type I restriction enzyme, R subunit
MKAILPNAMFIGFTGTPLLRADKKKSIEVFGRYIHTYKFDEAVKDGVIVDLRYEARDIDQNITSQAKIDQRFEAKTKGLTDLLFNNTDLKGRCTIVTSYKPSPADIKGEESGKGKTERLRQYEIYQKMLADWFNKPPETAVNKVEEFEKAVKKKFVHEPGQMTLLIVVDKLLTGFDAPPATYLYIDKNMQDHGLFQAICRVNRLDNEDKEYGYIIDYKDLFNSLEGAVHDYTSGALDGYDKEDVAGLLKDRLVKAREHLEETREAVKALCEPVEPPRDTAAYLRYFCAKDSGNAEHLKANEANRLALYKHVAALVRAFANLANELKEAGYTDAKIEALKSEVDHFEKVRTEVKLASSDYIDLKTYEPAMRHLIDTYIRAEDSEKISAFDDMSLVQLIVERGANAVGALPDGIRENKEAVAAAIELHVRPETSAEQRDRLLQRWYREQLKELVPPLLDKWQKNLDAQADDWAIKKMKTRWGTCNAEARRIWLNLELVKKPAQCLEYIVVHELAHLIERHHNDRFIAIMDKHLPQWRLYRAELNSAPLAHETWSY